MYNTLKNSLFQAHSVNIFWSLFSLAQIILFVLLLIKGNESAGIAFFMFCGSLIFLSPDYVAMSEKTESLVATSWFFMFIAFIVLYQQLGITLIPR